MNEWIHGDGHGDRWPTPFGCWPIAAVLSMSMKHWYCLSSSRHSLLQTTIRADCEDKTWIRLHSYVRARQRATTTCISISSNSSSLLPVLLSSCDHVAMLWQWHCTIIASVWTCYSGSCESCARTFLASRFGHTNALYNAKFSRFVLNSSNGKGCMHSRNTGRLFSTHSTSHEYCETGQANNQTNNELGVSFVPFLFDEDAVAWTIVPLCKAITCSSSALTQVMDEFAKTFTVPKSSKDWSIFIGNQTLLSECWTWSIFLCVQAKRHSLARTIESSEKAVVKISGRTTFGSGQEQWQGHHISTRWCRCHRHRALSIHDLNNRPTSLSVSIWVNMLTCYQKSLWIRKILEVGSSHNGCVPRPMDIGSASMINSMIATYGWQASVMIGPCVCVHKNQFGGSKCVIFCPHSLWNGTCESVSRPLCSQTAVAFSSLPTPAPPIIQICLVFFPFWVGGYNDIFSLLPATHQ